MSESTISFYHTGIKECFRCNTPKDVFICSITETKELCIDCWKRQSSIDEAIIPTAETHPVIVNDEPKCAGCFNYFVEDSTKWRSRLAYLADKKHEVRVHAICSDRVCECCDYLFALYRNRSPWRTDSVQNPVPADRFVDYGMGRVEGRSMCTMCREEYIMDNGGEEDFTYCNSCDEYYHYDNTVIFDHERYCNSCYENNMYTCRNCGEEYWSSYDHDCGDEDDALIHSYSYRPSPYFFGEGKYYFGFELEVESRSQSRYDGARIVCNQLNAHAYIKEDGSLNDGFEIVTHPHTLEKYQTDFDWSVLRKLQMEGYRSWNTSTCGLHVHVSRSAFGNGNPYEYSLTEKVFSQRVLSRQAHELRFMKLIYDNQRQVERIAGRSNNSYATFSDKGYLVRKVKTGHQNNGRYSAINTENDNTIEVRVFKGSLRKERVLSAIEFVHACVEYTRNVKVSTKNHALSWLKFTGYVSENSEMYPNLVTIMSESFAGDSNPDESN